MSCFSFHYRTLVDTMEIVKEFSGIVLVLVITKSIAATIVKDKFKNVESGENITGIIIAESQVRSLTECASR